MALPGTCTDLELSSLRNSLDLLTVHDQPNPVHAIDREYVPPDGGYGWVCVACVFLVNAHTWGLNFVSGLSITAFSIINGVVAQTGSFYRLFLLSANNL